MPEVLTRFRDAVGVGRVAGPKIEEGRRDLYRWVARSYGDVRRTGHLIGPWLSADKRAQFRAAVGLTFPLTPLASYAWAAGLFDAEGSVSLGRHRTHARYEVIDASVTQVGPGVVPEELLRFQVLVTLGKIYGPYAQGSTTGSVYRWRLSRADHIRTVLHLIGPHIGSTKSAQAREALMVIDAQPALPRGRSEWGSHKTHCVHGHEYATARLRPYVSRGGMQRRDSKQCLVCAREQASASRSAKKALGDVPLAESAT